MKRIISMTLTIITTLVMVVAVSSCCKDDGYTADVKVQSISLDQQTLALTTGAKATLKATVAPDNATNKNVTWSSSNEAVAKVDAASGEVTAVAVGTATITATAADGSGKTATCEVTVSDPVIAVTGITLNKTTLPLTPNAKETLTATVAPENATNKNVTWSSSNEAVAKVDAASGEVTAVAVGTATITATAADGSGKTATCEVTVSDPVIAVTGITLNKTTLALTTGAKATLKATVAPDNATNKNVTWSSSNEAVAKVDAASGEVTAVAAGTATITATAADGSGKTATCKVTVGAGGSADTGITPGGTTTDPSFPGTVDAKPGFTK